MQAPHVKEKGKQKKVKNKNKKKHAPYFSPLPHILHPN